MFRNRQRHEAGVVLAIAAGLPTLGAFIPDIGKPWVAVIGLSSFALTWGGNLLLGDAIDQWVADRRSSKVLDAIVQPKLQELHTFDDTARMNVMVIRRRVFRAHNVEFHTMANMEHAPDRTINLTTKQGAIGFAFRLKKWVIADLDNGDRGKLYAGVCGTSDGPEEIPVPEYGLSRSQRDKLKHLRLVYSYPFFRYVRGEGDAIKEMDVLGFVNVDSQREKALEYYRTVQVQGIHKTLHKALLEDILPAVAAECSWQFS